MKSQLLFLSNELMNPSYQNELRIPLTFIQFAHIEGKMFRHFRNNSNFVALNASRQHGNKVVYGALFKLDDFDFYIRLLDAYHMCSLSTLHTNHINDIHHRIEVKATPIYFSNLDDFSRLKYAESQDTIDVQAYVGNLNHPKIIQRTNKTVSYRIISGVDANNFKKLFGEVNL